MAKSNKKGEITNLQDVVEVLASSLEDLVFSTNLTNTMLTKAAVVAKTCEGITSASKLQLAYVDRKDKKTKLPFLELSKSGKGITYDAKPETKRIK